MMGHADRVGLIRDIARRVQSEHPSHSQGKTPTAQPAPVAYTRKQRPPEREGEHHALSGWWLRVV